jgi:hypothetical protein
MFKSKPKKENIMKKSKLILLCCALIVLVGAAPVALAGDKWEQLPDPTTSGLHCHEDIKLADDFQCQGGDITKIRWYGNYETTPPEIRGSGIATFHLSLHNCDTLAVPWHLPLEPELTPPSIDAPFAQCNETYTGLVNNGGEKIYVYEYVLPVPYPQVEGTWYWLDVMAQQNDLQDPAIWRWQEARRGPVAPLGHAPAASRTDVSPWSSLDWPPVGELPERYSDMAFEIISVEPIPTLTEWGMIVLGALVLVCGVVVIKHRLPKVA